MTKIDQRVLAMTTSQLYVETVKFH